MVAALSCVRLQFQWYQLAYSREIKSIQLHDSIWLSQKIVSSTLHYITLLCSQSCLPVDPVSLQMCFNKCLPSNASEEWLGRENESTVSLKATATTAVALIPTVSKVAGSTHFVLRRQFKEIESLKSRDMNSDRNTSKGSS